MHHTQHDPVRQHNLMLPSLDPPPHPWIPSLVPFSYPQSLPQSAAAALSILPCTHDFCLILPPSPWPSSLSQRLLTYYTAPASLNPFPILPPESPQDRRLPPRNTSTHACKRWLGICSKYYQIIITCEGGYLGGASHPPTRKKPSEDQTLASNCTLPPVIFIRGSCSGVLDA